MKKRMAGLAILAICAILMGMGTLHAEQPDFDCQAAKDVQEVMARLKASPDTAMMAEGLETEHKGHPFILAVRMSRDDLVEALIKAGFDPKAVQSNGDYPLDVAVNGWSPGINTDVIVRLLEAGADPNVPDVNGIAPLHYASMGGKDEIVRLLLKHGANPNLPGAEDSLGKMTPLHVAVRANHGAIIEILLAGGGDPHQKNSENISPLDMAKSEGKEDLVKILSAATAKTDSTPPADNAASSVNNEKATGVFKKAVNLAKENKFSEAIPLFQECYKADPKNDNYAYYLALAQAKADKTVEAIQVCKDLLQRNPKHEKAAKLLATLNEKSE